MENYSTYSSLSWLQRLQSKTMGRHFEASLFSQRLAPSRVRIQAQAILWLGILFLACHVSAQQRFPPPDFESGHRLPVTTTPAARSVWIQYLDLGVLAGCMIAAVWLVYQKRSRKGLVALSLFSLAYFGFWRKGCVCSIGSLQNVSLALFDPGYAAPVTVIAFFVIPLVVALFFGRTFCAAVCPHGALQDLVLLKPKQLPQWLEHGLGIFPFIYLGAAILLAATGSAFVVCQYDPFVPLFRMSGRSLMVLSGVALLILGVFVGRPYCRFICPYGALLKLAAAVARRNVSVTPDRCTQCRLCETSCPYGALKHPQSHEYDSQTIAEDRRRLAWTLLMAPVLVLVGAYLGNQLSAAAAGLHPTVALAQRLIAEQNTAPKTGTLSPDDLALARARLHPDELLAEASTIRRRIQVGSWFFGAWVGAVLAVKLISLGVYRQRRDYQPAGGECFACARCYEFCPSELARRGVMPGPAVLVNIIDNEPARQTLEALK